ncbi:hypothetical protein ACUL41_12145 [Virgibacillus natechei]|uniref:hypothetical protein n=1 Tax=Virgibacillus sp. CBA3643 TaxID=2942278 RepID=UPI0035A34C8F
MGLSEAELLSNGHVMAEGNELSLQKWWKEIYGWSTIQTYRFAVHEESGLALSEIRANYMDKFDSSLEGGNHESKRTTSQNKEHEERRTSDVNCGDVQANTKENA